MMSDIPIQKCPAVEYQESFVLFYTNLQLLPGQKTWYLSGEDQEISKREIFFKKSGAWGKSLDRIGGDEFTRISKFWNKKGGALNYLKCLNSDYPATVRSNWR